MSADPKKKQLFFFTNAYPYGIGEQWKTNELKAFQVVFESITVIPLHNAGNDCPITLNPSIKVYPPLVVRDVEPLNIKRRLSVLFGPKWFLLKEFIQQRAYRNKEGFNNWNFSAFQLSRLLRHPTIKDLLPSVTPKSVFYFYWGVGSCDLIPFLKQKFPEAKFYVRFHGYDLYEERNRGYIPFRVEVLKALTAAIAISDFGVDYLVKNYSKQTKFRIIKNRLGTHSLGRAKPSEDGVLRVVSCAALIPLKRVHLILESLQQLEVLVEWTHIGGGELFPELEEKVKQSNANLLTVRLLGKIAPQQVMEYYVNSQVDLFLHTSETEGVPVSIMEALSAGIPVIATDAGGTSELIDDRVGKLLPLNFRPSELTAAVLNYRDRNQSEKNLLRMNAYQRYRELCDADKNAHELAVELIK